MKWSSHYIPIQAPIQEVYWITVFWEQPLSPVSRLPDKFGHPFNLQSSKYKRFLREVKNK